MIEYTTSNPFAVLPLASAPVPLPAEDSAAEALARIEEALDQLDELFTLLAVEDSYHVPPLGYELPPDFKLSVVVPVYNEENTIRTIISRLLAQKIPMEVIVVDDHSIDMTRDVLYQLEGVPQLKVIYKEKNEGKGAALRTGFAQATGDVVIVQDADMEYDPRDIAELIVPLVDGEADVVYGSRFAQGAAENSSLMHRLGNRLLTIASNWTTGLQLTDMETCYKAFRREVIQGLELKQDRFGFEPEVTAKIARHGYRVEERPISYHARDFREGKKIGLRDAFNALWCIFRYAWRD